MEDAIVTNRRAVLRWAGSGIAVAFAGCSANSGGRNRHTATGRGETPRSAKGEPAAKTGPVEIRKSKFKTVKKTIPPDDVVWGTLKNIGKKYVTFLEVEAVFRNEAGRVIDTQTAHIEGLEPGGVWETYLPSFETPERVATDELALKKVVTGPPPDKPDAAAVIEDSLHPPRESNKTPTAVGEVENTGEETIDFTVRASFYATNENVLLDTGSTEITDLSPEETREFTVEFSGYEVLAAPRVFSYDVSLIE